MSKTAAAAATKPNKPAMPMMGFRAEIRADSISVDKRTVDLVWSTGARVRRFNWYREEYYDEELSLDPAHVRMARLNSGAPLLNTHSAWDLSSVLGVVERAAIDGKQGTATVRFPAPELDEDADKVFRKVQAGIIRNVSVGYRVHKWERTPPAKEGDVAIYRAVDWEPLEISLVPIGADAGAGVRADDKSEMFPCEIVEMQRADAQNQEVRMDKDNPAGAAGEKKEERKDEQQKPAPSAADAADQARVRAEAAKAERERIGELQQIARTANHGLPADKPVVSADVLREHTDKGTSVEEFRKLAFAELAKRAEEGGEVKTHARVIRDERDTTRAMAENAIMHRVDGKVKLEDGAREFRGMTMLEIARDLLERRGVKVRGMGRFELAGIALGLGDQFRAVDGGQGTSDLANILANVMNKTLRRNYEGTPRTFTAWANQSTNPDFKTITRTILSGAPSLVKVNESGEFKRGAVTDGKETYQLATYGVRVAFSRQALVNDDMNALSRMPQLLGRAAADLESDTVYAILTANAALADTVALFHATHANLASPGTVIDVTSLGAGRNAIRQQKGLEGRVINLAPKYLIVPSAREQIAYQYTSANYVPATPGTVNEFRAGGKTALEPIVEPRLDANSALSWYLAADPAAIDTVEYCYLEGNEGVYTETRVGFEVDGIEMKVRQDFAAKALDYRGLYKNPGA